MSESSNLNLDGLEYAVLGLGSAVGHSAYFNIIGKSLDKRIDQLGGSRVMELGLGDDGDCIKDDLIIGWMDLFICREKKAQRVV